MRPSYQKGLRLEVSQEPDVCDSVDPGQLGIPVRALTMCDFYEVCGTAGSAARATRPLSLRHMGSP